MRTKHTPGPWSFRETGASDIYAIESNLSNYKHLSTKERVATVTSLNEPDIKLMTAAPELLSALIAMLSCIDQHTDDLVVGPIIENALAAIAKATGESK